MKIDNTPSVSQMATEQKQLWNTCQQLEQVFLEILLQQMNSTATKSSLLPESFQSNVYQDMQRQSLAEQMAKSGGIGLASTLYQQLNRELAASIASTSDLEKKNSSPVNE